MLQAQTGNTLIIAHRQELLYQSQTGKDKQAADKFRMVDPM